MPDDAKDGNIQAVDHSTGSSRKSYKSLIRRGAAVADDLRKAKTHADGSSAATQFNDGINSMAMLYAEDMAHPDMDKIAARLSLSPEQADTVAKLLNAAQSAAASQGHFGGMEQAFEEIGKIDGVTVNIADADSNSQIVNFTFPDKKIVNIWNKPAAEAENNLANMVGSRGLIGRVIGEMAGKALAAGMSQGETVVPDSAKGAAFMATPSMTESIMAVTERGKGVPADTTGRTNRSTIRKTPLDGKKAIPASTAFGDSPDPNF